MKEKKAADNEIDLIELCQVLLRHIGLIVLVAVLVGALFLGYTVAFITPTYTASAMMYVNNSSFSVGSTSFSFSASELSAAQSLIDTYAVIARSRSTLNQVIDDLNLPYTYEELYEMIEIGSVDGTEVFSIDVTSESAAEAEIISNKLVDLLPESIASVVDGSDVRTVDYATIPSTRTSPSYTRNTLIGVLVGAVLAIAIVLIRYFLDDIVRGEDYLALNYPEIPLLATIPDMTQTSSGGYGYYNRGERPEKKKKKRREPVVVDVEPEDEVED